MSAVCEESSKMSDSYRCYFTYCQSSVQRVEVFWIHSRQDLFASELTKPKR